MPLVDLKTDLRSIRFGSPDAPGDRPNGAWSNQPYITTPIGADFLAPTPNRFTIGKGSDFILRGGASAFVDATTDDIRLGKMFTDLKTPNGIQFVAKQELLSMTGVNIFAGYPTSVRALNRARLNDGVYTPLSTLLAAGPIGNLIGGHPNKQGLDPTGNDGSLSRPQYVNLVNRDEGSETKNRLLNLDKKFIKSNEIGSLFSYLGGPNAGTDVASVNTTIHFAKDGTRTGINNPKLAGTSQLTQQFIAPTVGQDASRYYDYSVFKNKTRGTNYLNQVLTTGVTKQWVLRKGEATPELLDGLINEEGQIIRGGQDATGEKNSLAVTRPGYFYGEPGKTGKEPFTPGNYLQSLSLLTKGGTNSLNRNWNSVSRTFQDSFGNKVNNEINEDGDKLYTPSVYKTDPKFGFQETDPKIASSQGSAALTQDQILSQILSRNSGTQVQDFRKEIKPPSIGTEAYDIARKNGTLTDAPNYSNPNVRFEGRVNLGDPGNKDLNRSNYTKGALKEDGTPNVVDQINALYMYNAETVTTSTSKNDFVKFRFAVINPDQPKDKTFVHFRAIFDGAISDNMSANWDSFKYLGRAEEFYNYTGFSRDISFGFTVVAQSKPELSLMYQKLNYLQSSLTPNYNSTDGFMRGNIHQLTIGGYFYEQPGVITTLNYTMPGDSTWEIGIPSDFENSETSSDNSGIKGDPSVKELTHRIEVSIGFKPIHTFLPQIVGSAFDRTNNPKGVFGKGNIKQRYIALANDGDTGSGNDLYAKGTEYRTEGDGKIPYLKNNNG